MIKTAITCFPAACRGNLARGGFQGERAFAPPESPLRELVSRRRNLIGIKIPRGLPWGFLLPIVVMTSLLSGVSWARSLPLPENLTALNSVAGKATFLQSKYKEDYWPLSENFVTEFGLTYCGPASMVMILNSLPVSPPITPDHYPYARFTQTNLFYASSVLKITTPSKVSQQGITLDQAAKIAKQFGLQVAKVYGSQQTLKGFINDLKKIVVNKRAFILVNFLRTGIQEVGGGHFSPIGAYNDKTGQVLIMDVARYKYPPTWVKASTLLKAMQTVDAGSHLSRGYLVLRMSG